jgi:nicotinate-nucleotide pyrophosphorylase (carboxylating)
MTPLGSDVRERVARAGLDPAEVERVIRAALNEDLRDGPDLTTLACIPPEAVASATFATRNAGVVAGLDVALMAFELMGRGDESGAGVQHAPDLAVSARFATDGDKTAAGQRLLTISGNLATILMAERTALNLLCHLSGIATLTRAWVDAVNGTKAKIRDTRKTTPGLRSLEKYAVRCGGGVNHRMSLGDAVLIKDNHVAGAGSVAEAIGAVRGLGVTVPVEVECDTLEQVEQALAAGAGEILLDNFALEQMRAAVELAAGRAVLEASGGLRLEQAGAVALTGVDYLAVGALTHSAPVLDIGLDLAEAG